MPGLGDLDANAWSEIPLGMDAFSAAGRGLIRWRGWWRIVVGSPAWGFFYGRNTVPGWDAPGMPWHTPEPGGDRWDQSADERQQPGPAPAMPSRGPDVSGSGLDTLGDPIMANATNTTFAVTPGSVEADAKGNLATSGASVDLTTSGTGDTTATVRPRARGWMDWLPWIFVLGAVGMVLGRKKE